MKVENPAFDSCSPLSTVQCSNCPFADEDGNVASDLMDGLCNDFSIGGLACPSAATYAEACELADAAMVENKPNKEAK